MVKVAWERIYRKKIVSHMHQCFLRLTLFLIYLLYFGEFHVGLPIKMLKTAISTKK
jgi:hypothetical protein